MSSDNPSLATDQTSSEEDETSRPLNVVGLLSMVVFYLAVLAVGVWAGWKRRRMARAAGQTTVDQEEMMLAGRGLGVFVGVLTTGATWVGGGFINGTAEVAYNHGLVWVQGPFGAALALIVSGAFFARKMRDSRYVTMIDPFTQKYGKWGCLHAIVAAFSETLWSAAILGALGSTLQVILGFERVTAIISSAVIAVMYTLIGGLISVAYTDVFQLFFIAFGLILALPFAINNEHVDSISWDVTDWRGTLSVQLAGEYFDYWCLLILGGVPWQAFFQRALSAHTSNRAMWNAYGGGLIAMLMAIPPILFGGVAKATDWAATDFGRDPRPDEYSFVLPLCLQYLTPPVVAFFGLGAISAAVMSSTDSSMLSAASMLSRNVYKTAIRPQARDSEVLVALWIFITINAVGATSLAIFYTSVYNLFILCGDLVYVILFPQFLLVLYYDKSNTYGSLISYFMGIILRLLCGDTLLKIPAVLPVNLMSCSAEDLASDPDCSPGPIPFRTVIMLFSIVVHMLISATTHHLFTSGIIPLKFDFLKCFNMRADGFITLSSSRHLQNRTVGTTNGGVKLEDL